MTHWSCRTLAAKQGVSKSTINNIWQAHNLKPHRVKTFKLSRDAKFLEKMTDVIGLYLSPPQQAIVLCVDEKRKFRPWTGLNLDYRSKRVRHKITVLRLIDNCSEIATSECPWALANTIWQRITTCCGVPWAPAHC
jgi:hypothetical protein